MLLEIGFIELADRFILLFVFILEKGDKGMYHAAIIDSHLIDFYIPFLPLEKRHVLECVKTDFKEKNFLQKSSEQNKYANDVLNQMNFEQFGSSRFSTTGCKRVSNIVRNLIVQHDEF